MSDWLLAFIQVLIALIIFSLGIPIVVSQLNISDNLRRRVWLNLKNKFVLFMSLFLVLLGFIVLCSKTSEFKTIFGKSENGIFLTAGMGLFAAVCFLFYLMVKLNRKQVIESVADELKVHFNRSGVINANILADLIYDGDRCESGADKQIVLESIASLCSHVTNSEEPKYDGKCLRGVILGIEQIICDRDKLGDDTNFEVACKILNDISLASTKDTGIDTEDRYIAVRSLGRLTRIAIQKLSDKVAIEFLQLVDDDTESLLEYGIIALEVRKYSIATYALNKLESIAEANEPVGLSDSANLFGLIAHFWNCGTATKRRADSFLQRMSGKFEKTVDAHVQAAINHHYNAGNYVTVNELEAMHVELNERNY